MQDNPPVSSTVIPEPVAAAQPEQPENVVFVLRYDEELRFLVNEGVIRPGMQPSGLKDK